MTERINKDNPYNRKPPVVSVIPSPSDISYAAGFFDGEGTIIIAHASGRYRLFVAVGQKDRRPLDFLKDRFSGTIYSVRQPNKDRIYHWQIGQLRAEYFLQAIFPFLIHKKEQAKVALDYRASIRARPRSKINGDAYAEADKIYRDALVAIRANLKAESQ